MSNASFFFSLDITFTFLLVLGMTFKAGRLGLAVVVVVVGTPFLGHEESQKRRLLYCIVEAQKSEGLIILSWQHTDQQFI